MIFEDNIYKPISFWSWNGEMEEKELRWQIRELKEQGFGGFFIHSRAGRLIPYMGTQWLEACGYAIDEARKQGLDVWLYDEDGWPSGFAGGIVNGCDRSYWARSLSFTDQFIQDDFEQLLCVYKRTAGGYVLVEDAADADLFCYVKLIPTYVDLMNPAVTTAFLQSTHEVYKSNFGEFFGNTIKGIFTDEPQLLGELPWSDGLQDKYQELYGADILEDLWKLSEEESGHVFKYRYRKLTNLLFEEGFVRQINDWCKENHILFTGHFSHEDGLVEQLAHSGGVMPFYRHMGMPGIDHLGNRYASVNLMKQVTSVAHRQGIRQVLSESFGCSGWNVSFKELIAIAGWQAVFGVNTICTHLSAYTLLGRRKRDYPPVFSYQEPWWDSAKVLMDAITCLNTRLSDGERLTHVAVIHPMASAWCLGMEETKYISSEFRELQNHLMDLHVDYDLLDESEILDAMIDERRITIGQVAYSVVIVPETYTLSAATVLALERFAKGGGTVYFMNGLPQTIEGDTDHELLSLLGKIPAVKIQNSRTILQKVFRRHPVERPYDLLDSNYNNEVEGLVSRYIRKNGGATLYCFNPKRGADIKTWLRHQGQCNISTLNILDGTAIPLATVFDGTYTNAEVSVPSGEGVLLLIDFDAEPVQALYENTRITALTLEHVTPTSCNCLTLDKGRIQIMDESFSKEQYVINCCDEIYRRMTQTDLDGTVQIEYCFHANFHNAIPKLYLAYEKNSYVLAEVNGHAVSKEDGWFVDKGIVRAEIGEFVQNGANQILLRYTIPNLGKVNDLDSKFESERNRFFYEVEPENIYLLGEFDLLCNGIVSEKPNAITVAKTDEKPLFVLTDSGEKGIGELTKQNLWFYRGDVSYETEVEYQEDGTYRLTLPNMKGILAELFLGEEQIGVILSENEACDITSFLQKGRNRIVIKLRGSNRNLLGPHHHIKGEQNFVGPSTYSGIKGWEDFVFPDVEGQDTYTDDYAFVPFGIGSCILTVEESDKGV